MGALRLSNPTLGNLSDCRTASCFLNYLFFQTRGCEIILPHFKREEGKLKTNSVYLIWWSLSYEINVHVVCVHLFQ